MGIMRTVRSTDNRIRPLSRDLLSLIQYRKHRQNIDYIV
jgi:hypothetical protein